MLSSVCRDGADHLPYPSAGGIYGVEVYLYPVRAELLDSDVLLHVLKTEQQLERLWPVPGLLAAALPSQTWGHNAAAAWLITAVMTPYVEVYGERGYRFALQESGIVAHQLASGARAAGVTSCIIGGFADRVVMDGLDLRHDGQEHVLAMVLVGRGGTTH